MRARKLQSTKLPPAPVASSPSVLQRMRRQARQHTSCELALRSALHRQGLRFKVDCRVESEYRRRADIVFAGRRVAVFVDGCFWHGCAKHGSKPKKNRLWWSLKIHRNQIRDRQTSRFLRARGWKVIRIWEHTSVAQAVRRVVTALDQ